MNKFTTRSAWKIKRGCRVSSNISLIGFRTCSVVGDVTAFMNVVRSCTVGDLLGVRRCIFRRCGANGHDISPTNACMRGSAASLVCGVVSCGVVC